MSKPVRLKARADEDIDRALDHYALEAPHAVDDLISAFKSTLASIGRSPGAGSGRYADEVGLPGLRHRLTRRFPYVIFYMVGPESIEVLRVLHQRLDIPLALQDER